MRELSDEELEKRTKELLFEFIEQLGLQNDKHRPDENKQINPDQP